MEAEAVRSIQQAEKQKRDAAFKRLTAAQRDEERFTQYRIRLARREASEKARIERQAAAAARRASSPSGGSGAGSALLGGIGMGGLASAGGIGALIATAGYVAKQGFDTASKIEQAKMRLTALLGSQEAASAELKDMVRAAAKTKFDWEDLVDASSSLSASFGNTDERRYVLASISDMVSVAGEGKETLNQVILAVNQVMGKGKLEAEEVNQIIEPLKGIVSRRDFYTEVARLMNITGKDNDDLQKKMAKKQKDGAISGRTAIQALTNVGRAKAGGGPAGSFAVQAGDSIEGQISNIKTGIGSLFAMADTEKWPAMVKLKVILGEIANLFTADSKEGAQFMQLLNFYSNGVVTIVTLIGRAMIAINAPIAGLIRIIDAARFTSLFDFAAWAEVGKNVALGIANGIKDGAVWVYDAVRGLATTAIQEIKTKLHIASPSRVMMQLGAYTGEGFARGIDGSQARVATAGSAMAEAAIPSALQTGSLSGTGTSRGGSYSITVVNQIDGSGTPVETAQATAAMTEAMLDRYFGRLAAQGT